MQKYSWSQKYISIIAISLTGLMLYGLLCLIKNNPKPHDNYPINTENQIAPFTLNNLLNTLQPFTSQQLNKQTSILVVWASWCDACKAEFPLLNKISAQHIAPIYGIVYRDQSPAVHQVLAEYGNPFLMIGDDAVGNVAVDLGIYGTPETFIISATGNILYRHIGIMTPTIWEKIRTQFFLNNVANKAISLKPNTIA